MCIIHVYLCNRHLSIHIWISFLFSRSSDLHELWPYHECIQHVYSVDDTCSCAKGKRHRSISNRISFMYSLPKISELIAENIEQLIAGMSVISQKPTRAEYDQTRLLCHRDNIWWSGFTDLSPGHCAPQGDAASRPQDLSPAQPLRQNSAQSLFEIVQTVHCSAVLQAAAGDAAQCNEPSSQPPASQLSGHPHCLTATDPLY